MSVKEKMMKNIYDYTLDLLKEDFQEINLRPFRAQQVFEWIYDKEVYDVDEMTNLSKDLRQQLKETYSFELLPIIDKQLSSDGTCKYLLEVEGGYIETVLMIHPYGLSLCVTTQLGCNMGCTFCASGLLKKQRNLSSGEIIQQILTVSKDIEKRISHVVLMGTGEPFDNYDEVMKCIYTMNHPKGLALGARHISVSTCGLVPMIEKFSYEPLQVNLAISLHAPNDEIRNQLLPINKVYSMDVLREAIKNYIEKTNRRVTIEYIMLKDINDKLTHARQLAHYLKGLNVYVNLIPYNSVDESGYQKSDMETVNAFKEELLRLRITTTLRKEHGTDIDGACGQLRAKHSRRI